MRPTKLRLLLSFFAAVLLVVPAVEATSVLRLDLGQMVSRSGNIFRATVLDVRSGSIAVGGGSLPTTTYVLRVEETFKGEFDRENATVEITMVGSIKNAPTRVGDYEKFSALPEALRLDVGSDYLLLTTPPSRAGLSTAVGLGQGAFSIFVSNRQEFALNAVNNANIGLDGPVAYSELAAKIRGLLGQ